MESDFVIKNGILEKCINPETEELTVPESVKDIRNHAFQGCAKLKKIYIPDSVESIWEYAVGSCSSSDKTYVSRGGKSICADLFCGCINLREIVSPSFPPSSYMTPALKKAAAWGFIRNGEKYKDQKIIKEYIKYISRERKRFIADIISYDDPGAIEFFDGAGILTKRNADEEFLYPAEKAKAIQCISYMLQWKDRNKKYDDIEKQMDRELYGDPYNAMGMGKIWKWEKISENEIRLVSYKGRDGDIVIPGRIGGYTVTALGEGIFSEMLFKTNKQNPVTSVTVPEGVREIGRYAFAGCKSLTSVKLPDTLETISGHAFYGCGLLSDISLPDSVSYIGENAFGGCPCLKITWRSET